MINNVEELKKYLSVSPNFDFEDFTIYIERANREFVSKYVGDLYTTINDMNINDESLKNKVINLLHTAVANFAYNLSTPFNSITMDGSGMANVVNDKRSPLTVGQLNDIRRELLRSAHSAMDDLLEVLEANRSQFPTWQEKYSTIYNQSIVNSTQAFQSAYNIHNSRQTFLALQPSIHMIEDRLLHTTFCAELIAKLKASSLDTQQKQLKEYLTKAVVMATIAKVFNEGIFEITPSGIKMKFDALPYEKNIEVPYNQQVKNKVDAMNANADQYISLAVQYIKENESVFTECNGNPTKTREVGKYQSIITKSIIGI